MTWQNIPNGWGDGESVEIVEPLSAEDVREHIKDMNHDAKGNLFIEEIIPVLRQVLTSIANNQPGASSAVRALALAALEVFK
jgi:hypothetical protein